VGGRKRCKKRNLSGIGLLRRPQGCSMLALIGEVSGKARLKMILVTGATGKTGRALVQQLVSTGIPVRAVVRDRTKAADIAALGVEIAVADLSKAETLASALVGIDKGYLMTAADPQQVMLHSNFIRAAKQAGVRHIVRHSVRGADLDSAVKLCRWHAVSEKELEDSGIAWTHLRPVYNMQNFFTFAPTIQSQGAFYAPMQDGAVSMVDTRDVATVAAAALIDNSRYRCKTYLITGPEALTFADAAEQLSAVLGKPVRYMDIARENARKALLQRSMPEWYVEDLLGFYDFYSTGAGAEISDAVTRITGQPSRRFHQFAQDYRSAFTGVQ
jgi:uncharacterized protein YbjT (DUF2867 family)